MNVVQNIADNQTELRARDLAAARARLVRQIRAKPSRRAVWDEECLRRQVRLADVQRVLSLLDQRQPARDPARCDAAQPRVLA
jgi:hypothetical protein